MMVVVLVVRSFIFSLVVVLAVGQNLNVSNTFGSNMVLQREPYSANIHGWASPGDRVTVTLTSVNMTSSSSVLAGPESSWKVTLAPVHAGGPYSITVVSERSTKKILLENVLFGDVWICSGQSNMQFSLVDAFNGTQAIAAANDYPDIRVFTVGQSHYSNITVKELLGIAQPWSVASNKTVPGFSAVCWFTAINLYNKYKVPLGLISSNWGGTVIQAWSSPAALKACNVTYSLPNNEGNSVLYNAMIYPFLPQTVLGALWYQGEQNVGQAPMYKCLFKAMILDWRASFPFGDLTFLFVQLAAYTSGADVQDLRQAQWDALMVPKVGGATAVDLGDPTSPYGDIHPRDKTTVGARLALAAEGIAYGDHTVSYRGPEFSSVSHSIAGSTLRATFLFNLFLSRGLTSKKNSTCSRTDPQICYNWMVFLSNGKSFAANETAVGPINTVQIQLDNVPAGVTVKAFSYAYSAWPYTTVFNREGLPAIPFFYNVTV